MRVAAIGDVQAQAAHQELSQGSVDGDQHAQEKMPERGQDLCGEGSRRVWRCPIYITRIPLRRLCPLPLRSHPPEPIGSDSEKKDRKKKSATLKKRFASDGR